MNYKQINPEFPPLTIDYEQLKEISYAVLTETSNSFDFSAFTSNVARHLVKYQLGLPLNEFNNLDQNSRLKQKDINLLREIVWDFIILRYLTPGGNGHDIWPSLTVTSRGKEFFQAYKRS